MHRGLATLTDVRPGEGAMVLKTAAILFCVIAGHTLMETARDTLFLGELPPSRLAVVYGILAAMAVAASRLSTRLVLRFGRRSGLLVTLVTAAYGACIFYLLPKTHTAIFGLYVFSGLVSSIGVVQFWMLASHWFTVAQGRRLFGLISAGGVVGAVAGASLAIAALRFTQVESLLLLAIGAYLSAGFVVTTVNMDDEPAQAPGPHAQGVNSVREAIGFLRQYPYVGRLAALLAVSTSALLVTDYLFKSVAARSFAADELGGFFATYYAALNGLALLVQLLVSGYLVQRLGVLSAFLVLPVLLLGGSVATLFIGGILTVVLATKAADGGLRHSLHRVTSELLWMPLPDEVRTSSKTFIDTVVVRIAQAVTASALLLCASQNWDDPHSLALGLMVLAILWAGLGIGLRRPYLQLFRNALVNKRQEAPVELDLDGVEFVIETLSSREPAKAIAAMDLLASNSRTRLIPALVLYHESPEVLIKALETITTADRNDWPPLATRLLDHEDGNVRVAAMRALSRVGVVDAAEERLYDVRPEVRGHAAFLVERRDDSPEPSEHRAIKDVMSMTGSAGRMAKLGLLSSITDTPEPRYANLLMQLVRDPDELVVAATAEAMTKLRDRRFTPFLIERLAKREGRPAVREALANQGNRALRKLGQALAEPTTDERLRRHIPRAIASFHSQRAIDMLVAQLQDEQVGSVRYRLIRALGRLVTRGAGLVKGRPLEPMLERTLIEHLRMAALAAQLSQHSEDGTAGASRSLPLLINLLEDKAAQALDRGFRLLQIMHPNEDVRSLQSAAESKDRRTRARALEYIDTLTLDTSPRIRRLFNVIVDDLSLTQALSRVGADIGPLPQDVQGTIDALRADGDVAVAALGLEERLRPAHAS
jgi:AAA family ATP:ADP antiporter